MFAGSARGPTRGITPSWQLSSKTKSALHYFRSKMNDRRIEACSILTDMGWGFRKSFNIGPLRINASKSGLGYSFGGRGFRVGRDARGRQYRSISIPGTGIFNRTYIPKGSSQNSPSYNSPVPKPSPSQTGNLPIGRGLLYVLAASVIYGLIMLIRSLL